jgi:uncharacterized protein (TIGR03083 family)
MDRHAVIRAEAGRFAELLGAADPEAHCPTCPEWNAADLLWHLTEVHLFWAGILRSGARTDEDVAAVEQAKPARPDGVAELLAMREQATGALLAELDRLDDVEPRWSWWAPDQTVGFTRRMQTYEATFHRVDAELTAGVSVGPIADDVAAGAVDHCVDVMWGWMPAWATYEPLATAAFDATDTGQSWTVEIGHWTGTGPESGNVFDEPRAVRGHSGDTASVTVAASAEQLARWAWTRGGQVRTDGTPAGLAVLDTLIANGIQ